MNALRSFSVLAALSLAGAAYAQTQTAPNGPSTSVTNPTLNPELDGASTAQRQNDSHNDMRMRVAEADSVSNGMRVKSQSGDLLGTVSSVVPGQSPNEIYVLVADNQGFATPVPYVAATTMLQNHTLVVDKARFEHAPKVQQYEVEDSARSTWEQKADNYWKKFTVSDE
jgi:hypothetical protein